MKLILIFILGAILNITNPTTDDFNFYLKQEVESRVKEENPLARLLIGGFVAEIISRGVYRKNYFMFSIYTIDASLVSAFKKDTPSQINFIGIFGKFIPTSDISKF